MFEKKHEPLAPISVFLLRLVCSFCFAIVVITIALGIGVMGYHFIENMEWLDAFVNAALTLSDMGPSAQAASKVGKIFTSLYALFSGLMFVTIMGIVFAPIVHRLLHQFHSHRKS